MPSYLLITIDPYFSIVSPNATSFANNFSSWSAVSSNTLKVIGPFNSSVVGIGVSGYNSQTSPPSSATYTTVASFDSSDGKID